MQRLQDSKKQIAKVFGGLFYRLERPGRPGYRLGGDSVENRPSAALEVSMDRGGANPHGLCELPHAELAWPNAFD
jgi:hypothetical protein